MLRSSSSYGSIVCYVELPSVIRLNVAHIPFIAVMEVMFAVPACVFRFVSPASFTLLLPIFRILDVFSAIVACRSFRRLDQFSEKRDSSACAGVRVQPYR